MKTLELDLYRRYFKPEYTIGQFSVDVERLCDALEDKNRDLNKDGDLLDHGEEKVFGETCIPFGRYRVILAMSPKFKRKLPLLLNVPHFTGILIHAGKNNKSTHGCIIPGENKAPGTVLNSKHYEDIIVSKIAEAEKAGVETYITIR